MVGKVGRMAAVFPPPLWITTTGQLTQTQVSLRVDQVPGPVGTAKLLHYLSGP